MMMVARVRDAAVLLARKNKTIGKPPMPAIPLTMPETNPVAVVALIFFAPSMETPAKIARLKMRIMMEMAMRELSADTVLRK